MATAIWVQIALTIGSAVLCLWLSMVIHELGHFAMMKSLGYNVVEISFGKRQKPILKIVLGGASVYFTPYIWAGVAVFDTDQATIKVRTYAAFLTAGSLANVLAILLVLLLKGSQDFVSLKDFLMLRELPTFWAVFIFLNLAYGIGELVPLGSDGDGTRLLKLWQKKYDELD